MKIYSGKKKWAEVSVVDGKLKVVWHGCIPMKGGFNRKESHLRNVAIRTSWKDALKYVRMGMERWKD